MLNKNTREILGQLGQINQSQIITYPVSTIMLGKAIQAFLDVSKLGEKEFEEIGVYDINQLNAVVSVIDDPEITNDNGTLTIKNKSQSIKYGTTTIDIIEGECRGNPDLLGRITGNNELVMNFEIDAKELERLKKMSGLLKDLTDLVISSEGGEITLEVTSKEKSSNNYSVNVVESTINEEVSMSLIMDVVKKLPNSGFKVSVYKSAKGSLVAVFESTGVEGLNIVLAAKAG
jgi:hypothetical protein